MGQGGGSVDTGPGLRPPSSVGVSTGVSPSLLDLGGPCGMWGGTGCLSTALSGRVRSQEVRQGLPGPHRPPPLQLLFLALCTQGSGGQSRDTRAGWQPPCPMPPLQIFPFPSFPEDPREDNAF